MEDKVIKATVNLSLLIFKLIRTDRQLYNFFLGSSFSFAGEDLSQLNSLLVAQAAGHFNLELKDEVSTFFSVHKRRERVVTVDRHAFAGEKFATVGVDHLVTGELNNFSVERFKRNWGSAKGLLQSDFVSVDKVVVLTDHSGVLNSAQDDNEISLAFQGRVVSPPFKTEKSSVAHTWKHVNLLDHTLVRHLSSETNLEQAGSSYSEASVLDILLGAEVEFIKGAPEGEAHVLGFDVLIGDVVFMQVSFNLFNHWDLLAIRVQGNVVRVACAKETFKNLHGITRKAVALVFALNGSISC